MDATTRPRHVPIREDWLALGLEEPVDPDVLLVDAHHHLWDKPGARYLWREMAADAAGHRVVATICVEGRTGYWTEGEPHLRPAGETAMVAALADEAAAAPGAPLVAAGIVGRVDLCVGTRAGEALDRHAEVSGGRFCGVRDAAAWHADPAARGSVIVPPPGLLYDPAFRQGLAELRRRDLVFDAWVYHTQLGELVDLAHAMPDLRIVVDHTGGPLALGPYAGRRAEVFEDWRHGMRKLASFPNVCVKLGGFGMAMSGFDFHERPLPPASDDLVAAWAPYFHASIELFGPSRSMFESNFPVDKGMASYRAVWNAFKKIAARYTPDERHSLLFETANRTYRLGLDAGARREASLRARG